MLERSALVPFIAAITSPSATTRSRNDCPASPPNWSPLRAMFGLVVSDNMLGALHVLGTDHGAVVPARRSLRRARHQPPRRHPGCWSPRGWTGDAGRHRRLGSTGRHLPARAELVARGPGRHRAVNGRPWSSVRSARCRSRRSCRSILAARRNGGPDPVSAYLHAAATWSRPASHLVARMAPGSPTPPWRLIIVDLGLVDHAAGRLARGPRVRPQTHPGVRHREPTWAHHGVGRRRRAADTRCSPG